MGRHVLVVGVLGAMAASACSSGSSANNASTSTKVAFTFAPGTGATAQARSAHVLQARYRALGVKDARVMVDSRGLVALGPPAVRTLADQVARPGVLTFRPVIALGPARSAPAPSDTAAGITLVKGVGQSGVEYLVGPPALTGGVRTATARFEPGQETWSISLRFTPAGAAAFNRFAAESYQKSAPQNAVAIVLDDVVQSAPSIQQASFPNGVSISGSFTKAQAEALASVLNTGRLPAAVRPV